MALGLGENLDTEGYHFIEWADEAMERMLKEFLFEFVTISITPKGDIREYKVENCIN